MTLNLTLALTVSVLIGSGVYLILERSLTRVLVGLLLLGNGVNLAIVMAGGPAGDPPIVRKEEKGTYGLGLGDLADPLPQALALTAIVIALATTAFLLAMAHRAWQLHGHDDVQDDVEDAAIRRLAEADETSDSYDLSTHVSTDDAAELRPSEDGSDDTGRTTP